MADHQQNVSGESRRRTDGETGSKAPLPVRPHAPSATLSSLPPPRAQGPTGGAPCWETCPKSKARVHSRTSSSPEKGPLLGAGRRGLLGSTPEDDALLRRKTRRDSEGEWLCGECHGIRIPPELDTVDALEDLFAGYNLRSARPTEALVTLASMADAEAAAAFLEHMSFSTGQIKVTFE
ncbi:unnamed protein product, partial [Cyprideis torosa]